MPRIRELNQKSDYDAILSYLVSPNNKELSPALEKVLNRVEKAGDWYEEHQKKSKVVNRLMRVFKISRATANRDINFAFEVYNLENKPQSKQFWIDTLMTDIREAIEFAKSQNDAKAYAAALRVKQAAIEKFFGDVEADPFEDVQPPAIMVGFFPELTKVALPDNWKEEVENLKNYKKDKIKKDGVI